MALASIKSDQKLRVAIVHYHLRPGGVTSVIESTLKGLGGVDRVEVVVITGDPCERKVVSNVRVVKGLRYAQRVERQRPDELVAALRAAAEDGLGGELPHIWHFHNHALGKLPAMADAVARLADDGERLLLQIHDFAEDGRPDNFAVLRQARVPYPIADHVHYAVLNSRDRRFLIDAGVREERVHTLPNPVEVDAKRCSKAAALRQDDRQLVLYPTRGIRRKNVGEAVLLAALLGDQAVVATTRVPDNPVWKQEHGAWQTFANKHKISISLGVVDRKSPTDLGFASHDRKDFASWLEAADQILTTSVAEGFGLVYLETLLTGHMLVGRDLPEITEDFKEVDLQFPSMYRFLRVPLEWVGKAELVEKVHHGLADFYQAYGVEPPDDALDRAMESMVDSRDRVDFGRLDEAMQRKVIEHLVNNNLGRQVVMETDGACADVLLWFGAWLSEDAPLPDYAAMRKTIDQHYGVDVCADRLQACYDRLVKANPSSLNTAASAISGLLSSFVVPERFNFLRT